MSEVKPKTVSDIIRGLLDSLTDREWVDSYHRCQKGCCGDWKTECSSCNAQEGDYGTPEYQQHEPGCALRIKILEAEAFIRAEENG